MRKYCFEVNVLLFFLQSEKIKGAILIICSNHKTIQFYKIRGSDNTADYTVDLSRGTKLKLLFLYKHFFECLVLTISLTWFKSQVYIIGTILWSNNISKMIWKISELMNVTQKSNEFGIVKKDIILCSFSYYTFKESSFLRFFKKFIQKNHTLVV